MTDAARTYGEALYELARDEGLSAQVLEELRLAVSLFQENPAYSALLSLPSLPKEERCGLLDESFRGQVHPYLLNFMKILTERDAIRQLPGCEEAYRRRYNEDNGILEVTAVTAVPLEDDLRGKLQKRLEDKTGKTVHLRCRVEERVIGGMRLELDGVRLDGTVRNRLDELQALLRSTVL